MGGTVYAGNPINRKNRFEYQPSEKGNTVYLMPKNNLSVRAIENCQILAIVSTKDSVKIVVAKGKINAGYGNLNKCYVSKGDLIIRGQIIGELFSRDSVRDNSLSIFLEKNGQPFVPKW